MLVKVPLDSGKNYYEVTLVTAGSAQIGWANEYMDVSVEVKKNRGNFLMGKSREVEWEMIYIRMDMMDPERHCCRGKYMERNGVKEM